MIKPKRRRFGRREVADAMEAASALALAALAIRLLPFRRVVRLMNVRAHPSSGRPPTGSPAAVRSAVKRASSRVPWRTVCFHEGLAAHWMLRRRGLESKVHYGIDPGEKQLSAHVWVTLDGEPVIGEEQAERHACVAIFP